MPTLTYKGKINIEMLRMYPGLYDKLNNELLSYNQKEKIKDNVYQVSLQKEKRNSP